MACNGKNPLKIDGGGDHYISPIKNMLAGFAKEDPGVTKMLPVEIDVVEVCCEWGLLVYASAKDRRTGDLIVIAFYFLLRVGEYTCSHRNSQPEYTKRTVNFRLCDVVFFKRDSEGRLRPLPARCNPQDRLTANGATLRLTNQKNGWKNVCIHQQKNNRGRFNPVEVMARIVNELHSWNAPGDTFLSAFKNEKTGKIQHVIADDVTKMLKEAAAKREYPELRGCPIDRINTHSLRSGGANALSLAGFSDYQIQKMGRWSKQVFKEYISDQLSNFTDGMSEKMSRSYNFVNIAAGAQDGEYGECTDVTVQTLTAEYPVVTDDEE